MSSPGLRRAAARAGAAVALLAAACAADPRPAGEAPPEPRWYRGNTHTHTLWSDGDAAPEAAVDWYAANGYDFLVISDHNILPEGDFWRPVGEGYKEAHPEHVAELRSRFGDAAVELRTGGDGRQEMRLKTLAELRERFERPGGFLLILGEEISDLFQQRPIHHGAVNIERKIDPPGGENLRELLRATLARIEAEGRRSGRPVLGHLNHPNYEWGVSAEDLAAVVEERFFEVYNGHRLVRNEGDAEHRSTEAIWDYVLTLRLATRSAARPSSGSRPTTRTPTGSSPGWRIRDGAGSRCARRRSRRTRSSPRCSRATSTPRAASSSPTSARTARA